MGWLVGLWSAWRVDLVHGAAGALPDYLCASYIAYYGIRVKEEWVDTKFINIILSLRPPFLREENAPKAKIKQMWNPQGVIFDWATDERDKQRLKNQDIARYNNMLETMGA